MDAKLIAAGITSIAAVGFLGYGAYRWIRNRKDDDVIDLKATTVND